MRKYLKPADGDDAGTSVAGEEVMGSRIIIEKG